MKKIVVAILILCLSFNGIFFSTKVFAQDSFEYSDEMLEISRDILTKLGLWYKTDQNDMYITRAEIARIVGVLLKIEENHPVPTESMYDDVPLEHWAYRYIHHISAYRFPSGDGFIGIMCGDGNGNFRPDDYITYQELAKVLVVLLGWYPYVEYTAESDMNVYPDVYFETARQLGIYPLSENKKAEYVTENDAVIILYNALKVNELSRMFKSPGEWYEQTEHNIVESRFDIFQVRGYAKVIDGNRISIDGVEYSGKVEDADFREGFVICFYKMDFYNQNESDLKPIVLCCPISSLDFDNPRSISDSIPEMFEMKE